MGGGSIDPSSAPAAVLEEFEFVFCFFQDGLIQIVVLWIGEPPVSSVKERLVVFLFWDGLFQ